MQARQMEKGLARADIFQLDGSGSPQRAKSQKKRLPMIMPQHHHLNVIDGGKNELSTTHAGEASLLTFNPESEHRF